MDTQSKEIHAHHAARRLAAGLRTPVACVSFLLLGVVSLLLAGSPQGGVDDRQANTGPVASTPLDQIVPSAENLSRVFRAAAKRVLPAVVVIKTYSSVDATASPLMGTRVLPDMPSHDGEEEQESDEYFFEEDMEHQPGLASGVIIDPDGIVLTNQHVIEGADEVTVLLPNGREFSVRKITSLAGVDLAMLHLDSGGQLPAATLGDSDTLDIGDWVLAMGCPLELEQTVSAGIISAKGRSVPEAGRTRLLQTDAAINPGSSGGPLVNLRGEVVAITTAIASDDGGYQGIGFAIPINLAKNREARINGDQRSNVGARRRASEPSD